jgi:uncharacterized repeat protein (TIGR03803 family)
MHSSRTHLSRCGTLAFLLVVVLAVALPAFSQTEEYFSFSAGAGEPVSPVVLDTAGNVYVIANFGSYGGIFKLSPNGDGTWTKSVIHRFTGPPDDGVYCPSGGPCSDPLIFDSSGNLYGTTEGGGKYNGGVVFKLTPTEKGLWTKKILHSFGSSNELLSPVGGVIIDQSGNLYGSANSTAPNSHLLFVYRLSATAWTETFPVDGISGQSASAPTIDSVGNLYGTSYDAFDGVYEVSPNSQGGWQTPTILHTSQGGSDGATHYSPVVLDSDGTLYGTTFRGGSKNLGTVYELIPGKERIHWAEKIIHSFQGGTYDGALPYGGVVLAGGNIYGTTIAGGLLQKTCTPFGVGGCGLVYELYQLTTWRERPFWYFDTTDGLNPYATLAADSLGDFYGTTLWGGQYGYGTVFEVLP